MFNFGLAEAVAAPTPVPTLIGADAGWALWLEKIKGLVRIAR